MLSYIDCSSLVEFYCILLKIVLFCFNYSVYRIIVLICDYIRLNEENL